MYKLTTFSQPSALFLVIIIHKIANRVVAKVLRNVKGTDVAHFESGVGTRLQQLFHDTNVT